jgi:hypothetical protein
MKYIPRNASMEIIIPMFVIKELKFIPKKKL